MYQPAPPANIFRREALCIECINHESKSVNRRLAFLRSRALSKMKAGGFKSLFIQVIIFSSARRPKSSW
ncbi:hypothetical protein B2M20_17635 [Nitrobacter vulgaris]|uniref:Uncharacterized protein n=1 Tax=Nitrobacter vulgaris TaxID=29421 RepID=A0A1V4HTZ7_NITVU|nr:hypothetical protein B2M20_17635 [Nitrobacter vulgaris]